VNATAPVIGVLALQGAFAAHERALIRLGAVTRQVRTGADLAAVDALVMPGGESTTMAHLLATNDLFEPLAARLAAGMPVFGTCAGMILLADHLEGGTPDQETVGGLDVVVRAATLLKARGRNDVRFLVVGDGATRESLAEQVREAGHDDMITVTGRQPKELVPGFLAISDCCLVHLRKTGLFETVLPSKIFEAAALERPIILGVKGFAEELVRGADCGICIEPEDELQLVDAIETLRRDPEMRRQMGERGRTSLVARYDIDRLSEDYARLVQDVRAAWLAGRG
jgi:putative intracellular protease/amidase